MNILSPIKPAMITGRNAFIFLSIIVSIILLSACSEHPTTPKDIIKPRNVLLISLDACRADHLGCYGYSRNTSPFLDQLSRKGIIFDQAFVNTFGTTTSHTTMFTSLYQETHRMEFQYDDKSSHFQSIPSAAIMIQEIFEKEGYITLAVTDGGRISSHFGFNRGFLHYDNFGGGAASGTRKLVRLISEHLSEDKPIYAFYHTYEIHAPYDPPMEDRNSENKEITFEASIENLRRYKYSANRGLSKNELSDIVTLYDGGISHTDRMLHRMFDQLERIGFLKSCLVIVTADHGEEFADHGGLLHRGLLYDELLHVPLIIVGTGINHRVLNHRLVACVDIPTTILTALGIDPLPNMVGRDLISLPTNPLPEGQESIYSQIGRIRYAIRTSNWKLIEQMDPKRIQLFNLHQDPKERRNLARYRKNRVDRMLSSLRQWKSSQPVISDYDGGAVLLNSDDMERLRALGYVYDEQEK